MPQEIPETFTPEAFRLFAREVLTLRLDDEQIEALRELVNGLYAELDPLTTVDLAGIEPEVAFAIEPEGWPR